MVHGDLKGVRCSSCLSLLFLLTTALCKANILVTPSGIACLADFGLASVADSQALKWTSLSTAARSGGTLRWKAPELVGCGLGTSTIDDNRSVPSTTSSDIYSFACVCYEVWVPITICIHPKLLNRSVQIFTGNIPFYEIKVDVAVYGALGRGRRPSRPSDSICLPCGLDDNMWNLVENCWDSDPMKRPHAIEVVARIVSRLSLPEDAALARGIRISLAYFAPRWKVIC